MNKVVLIVVLGVIVLIFFDMYVKYSEEKRTDDLTAYQLQIDAYEIANQPDAPPTIWGGIIDVLTPF